MTSYLPTHPSDIALACLGKEALDPARAIQVARDMKKRGKNASAYKCPHCGAWHVGSKLRKRKQ